MEYFKDCMTQEELRARYRELCVKMHPDRNADNPNATSEFQEMMAQYEERKAELGGDYTKARKGRERREREAREREEKERKERERRKVEMVIEQARLNRQKSHREWKAGDYVYARMVNAAADYWNMTLTMDALLRATIEKGVKDECVVVIEYVMVLTDRQLLNDVLNNHIPQGMPMGGWEVIQTADPASGVRKAKRVAKVIMFRSEHYCVFGNPLGDSTISDYYVPVGYADMFQVQLDLIHAKMIHEQQEKERIEAERKAKLLAEQQPLIDEWAGRLIEMSRGLSLSERETVAASNLKAVLKGKFPGTTFKMRADRRYGQQLSWEDGPTIPEVDDVIELFCPRSLNGELTPWNERYGTLGFVGIDRKMSVLTKARILQQLGQVTEAFRECGIDDEVELSDFDWRMLHAMVGVDVNDPDVSKCMNTLHGDGRRTVRAMSAVHFIFRHTSYKKAAKARKAKAA